MLDLGRAFTNIGSEEPHGYFIMVKISLDNDICCPNEEPSDSRSTTKPVAAVTRQKKQKRPASRTFLILLIFASLTAFVAVTTGVLLLISKASSNTNDVDLDSDTTSRIDLNIEESKSRSCPNAPQATFVPRPTSCTEMGCFEGYKIEVRPHSSWPSGNYQYILDVDRNITIECAGNLPLKACEDGPSMTCVRDDGIVSAVVSIVESG